MGDRPAYVLQLDRALPARRERVFEALTRAEDIARWWGPQGFTLPAVELDLRVGGRYRYTMQPPAGAAFHVSGEFLALDRPGLLSCTFRWDEPTPDDRETVVTLTLHDRRGSTRLALRQGDFATEERLELHRGGWTDSLDKLAALVGEEDRAGGPPPQDVGR